MGDSRAKVLSHVRAGPTKVTVTIRDGETLPMLQHGAKLYVVAAPNEEFQINVARWKVRTPPQPALSVSVDVDGQQVGYSNLIEEEGNTTCFSAFLGAPGAAPGELTRFKFQPVAPTSQATATVVNNPDEIKSGRIQVMVHALGDLAEPASPPSSPSSPPSPSPVEPRTPAQPYALPDTVKYFMAPSLRCGEGARSGQVSFRPKAQWRKALDELGSVELRYETVEYLKLRKVLDPTSPSHQRIIKKFSVQAAAGPDTPGATDRNAAGSKQRKRAKANGGNLNEPVAKRSNINKQQQDRHEVEVKPEAAAAPDTDLGSAGNSPAAVGPTLIIDLTTDAPLVVNGQELRKDQLAVCDLVGDGTEQQQEGAWQVMDKVKEEVVLD